MDFVFKTKANTFFSRGCVREHASEWMLGGRAYIVTGARSGRLSGALRDVEEALASNNVKYEVFEGVENNPSVEQCALIAANIRAFKAEFIVAIGGGSPIDAAKGAAVFALSPKLSADDLFANNFNAAMPIVAIPTTSGTGSEVTPWSVLTRHSATNKHAFGSQLTLPAFALLDADYTRSLSKRVTLHTAMDAYSHCLESIISLKATPITDALNFEAIRRFAPCMKAIEEDRLEDVREELLLVSMMGGMTIAHTGTALIHALGYPLTYFHGLTHGEANCFITLSALPLLSKMAPKRLSYAMDALGMSVEDLQAYIKRSFQFELALTDEETARYSALSMQQRSLKNTPFELDEAMLAKLYREALTLVKQG